MRENFKKILGRACIAIRILFTNPSNLLKTNTMLNTEFGYRLFLKRNYGVNKPRGYPNAPWWNAVLKARSEWVEATEQVKRLGLPSHVTPSKNWDSLAALDYILKNTDRTARILDAGTEYYSVILPWLFMYGYKHLIGINLEFKSPFRRGSIIYEHGDITQTRFKDNTFDVIICQSVIEHGVHVHNYFSEMSRILKTEGFLITSTDYWCEKVNTNGRYTLNVPIKIFTKYDIVEMFDTARRFNLELIDEINLDCQEKAVTWKEFNLEYTFIIFTLTNKN